jgi:hypothetical protein
MKFISLLSLATAAAVGMTLSVAAQQGQGPVATACKAEIAKYCAGNEHGKGGIRACLTAKKADVSPGCRTALDSTGPGQGMGKGKAN